MDPRDAALDARPAVLPARRRRRPVLLGLVQPGLRARRRDRRRDLWHYKQKLNEDLVAKQTHSPYNRGIALGYGNVYMGTLDGKLVAIDMKTGKLNWETKLIDSEKLTVGFTGAPLLVKDKVIIGSQGGEWPYRGPIFGVDAKTGKEVWKFFTVGGNEENDPTRATPGATTRGRPAAAAAGWPAATIRRPTPYGGARPTRRRCTTGPAPSGRPKGARPGNNLYTTSVIALDPDTGELKAYHQELPHDAWDFDSAVGEFVMLERGGKKYIVHPNKSGFVFVYDRKLKVQNVWRASRTSTSSRTSIRRPASWSDGATWPKASTRTCARSSPAAISWNSGIVQPEDRPVLQGRQRMVHGPRR